MPSGTLLLVWCLPPKSVSGGKVRFVALALGIRDCAMIQRVFAVIVPLKEALYYLIVPCVLEALHATNPRSSQRLALVAPFAPKVLLCHSCVHPQRTVRHPLKSPFHAPRLITVPETVPFRFCARPCATAHRTPVYRCCALWGFAPSVMSATALEQNWTLLVSVAVLASTQRLALY